MEHKKQKEAESRDVDRERLSESQRILERVERDSESIGTSSLARVANRVSGHFRADDSKTTDPAEIWGKRIARVLALIAFAFLAYHVVVTYILPA